MNTLKIENAHIFFRNFSGTPSDYNRNGKRTFAVELTEDMAQQLAEDGWNVKQSKPKNEDYFPTKYINVEVSYRMFSPDIYCYFGNKFRKYTMDTVHALDHLNFDHIDLEIQVSPWTYMGRSGLKGYLKDFRGVVQASPFADKYAGYANMDDPAGEENLPF